MPYDKTSSHSSRMWNILCFELHIIGSEISCIYTDVDIESMYGNGGTAKYVREDNPREKN